MEDDRVGLRPWWFAQLVCADEVIVGVSLPSHSTMVCLLVATCSQSLDGEWSERDGPTGARRLGLALADAASLPSQLLLDVARDEHAVAD